MARDFSRSGRGPSSGPGARCRCRARSRQCRRAAVACQGRAPDGDAAPASDRWMRGAVRGCGRPGRWKATSRRSASRMSSFSSFGASNLCLAAMTANVRGCPSSRSTRRCTSDRPLFGVGDFLVAFDRAAPDRIGFVVHVRCPRAMPPNPRRGNHAKIRSANAGNDTQRKPYASRDFLSSVVTPCSRAPRPLRGVHDNGYVPAASVLRLRLRRHRSRRRARSADLQVELRADSHADFRQWFHFRLQGARGRAVRIRFLNARDATYVEGWRDYHAVASYDREDWFRVPTTFDGGELAIAHEPSRDSIYYAYFEPYSWERHLVAARTRRRVAARAGARPRRHGRGPRHEPRRPSARRAPARKSIWVIARQHPGETMAEWFVEGMLERLLGPCRSRRAARARARGALRRAEHESRRQRARQPAHQRRRRQPQPRMAGADARAQSRGASTCARRCRRPAWTLSSTCTATRACRTCSPTATSGCRRIRRAWRRSSAASADALQGGQPRLPDGARLPVEQGNEGQPDRGVEMGRAHVRRARAHARDAVQGQRGPARSACAGGAARARGGSAPTR